MERDTIEELCRSLPASRRRRGSIARELRAHLEDTRRELVLDGWQPEDATRESLARLGNPDEIVDAFAHAYRPTRHRQLGLAVGLATALLLGAYGAGATLASPTSAHTSHAAKHVHATQKATRTH